MRLVIGLVVVLAACTPSLEDDAISFCQPLCQCVDVPLPAEQRECNDGCTAQFEQRPFGSSCVACVVAHADRCPTLLEDCLPVCSRDVLLPSYGRLRPESRIDR